MDKSIKQVRAYVAVSAEPNHFMVQSNDVKPMAYGLIIIRDGVEVGRNCGCGWALATERFTYEGALRALNLTSDGVEIIVFEAQVANLFRDHYARWRGNGGKNSNGKPLASWDLIEQFGARLDVSKDVFRGLSKQDTNVPIHLARSLAEYAVKGVDLEDENRSPRVTWDDSCGYNPRLPKHSSVFRPEGLREG